MNKFTASVPSEWAPQDAVWMTWPTGGLWWKDAREASLGAFAKLAAEITRFERAIINCAPKELSDARDRIIEKGGIAEKLSFNICETNDVWCRDSGAIFRINAGKLEALDFKYNAWGGKFPPWELDDALAAKMAKYANAANIRIDELTCEGGALEFDGNGTLMTTECVILNPNRNPGMSRERAEEILKPACGVSNIIWLKDGLFNDDTDGHIDNLARFAPGGKILAAVCGKSNPSHKQLQENMKVLKEAKNAEGKSYEVIELPVPEEPIEEKYYDGKMRVLPASYANYLVINGAVLMPAYGQKSDINAAAIISEAFPGRSIVPISSRVFLMEGGAVHCLTQQQPSL